MKYGNSELNGKFILGPMAAYTDIAYRLLCRQHGSAMCFTEFSNATALARSIPTSWSLAKTCKEEMPVGIQIFGSDEKTMARAVEMISEKANAGEIFASCIDINFGCPAGSVIRAGAGSAFLKNPEKIGEIVSACVSASDLPITAKLRAGWRNDESLTIAKIAEKAGASGITLHWRTATEGRRRQAGWEVLAKVKEELGIPLIANGGATSPELAVQMLRETNCDAVMIASGALGKPEIFSQADSLLEKGEYAPSSWEERQASFSRYCELAEKHGILSPKRLRIQAIEFLTGWAGVKHARKKLNSAKTAEEIRKIIEEFAPSA